MSQYEDGYMDALASVTQMLLVQLDEEKAKFKDSDRASNLGRHEELYKGRISLLESLIKKVKP